MVTGSEEISFNSSRKNGLMKEEPVVCVVSLWILIIQYLKKMVLVVGKEII